MVSIFIGQMLRGIQPVINGDGEQLRDYVYVLDVVRANCLVLDKGANDVINIGFGRGTSVNEIFSTRSAESCGPMCRRSMDRRNWARSGKPI